MARMIDANRLKDAIYTDFSEHFTQCHDSDQTALIDMVMDDIDEMPTLAPPNEWVKVMEAINNAAVAYIEGGPYENDLPGMEFALKIDRLSRDFVRPPEGEEST